MLFLAISCDFHYRGTNNIPVNDQQKFETLVENHKKILYKICRLYCPNPEDQEDLGQQIVIQLWQSFPSFDEGRCTFATWMYRVSLNVAISWYRREVVRLRHTVPANERMFHIAGEPDVQSDELRLIHRFIDNLDELHKALMLLYLDGYSNREIGEVLGITETNVTTKISRLKKTMRQEFRSAEKA